MIFKQETIKFWFTGAGDSINHETVHPFQNPNNIIRKYNLAVQHNSLTHQVWQESDWQKKYHNATSKNVHLQKSILENLFSVKSRKNNLNKQIIMFNRVGD